MPLSTNFTDIEFEYIREIAKVVNTPANEAILIEKLNPLNAAQVSACQRDIEKWKSVEYGDTSTKGGIKGTVFSLDSERAQIRTKMRERLNYPALPESIGSDGFGILSIGIPGIAAGLGDEDEFQSDGSGDW
jgi:hypothetical protein